MLWKIGIRVTLRHGIAPAMVKPLPKDDRRDTAKGAVVGGFDVLAGLSRFLVATEEEDPVVGAGRHGEADTSRLVANVDRPMTL